MYRLIELEMIDSTNNWAKREKASFPSDRPTFITAIGQTSGRGRGTNTWVSPNGQNLYMTMAEKVRHPLRVTDYALIAPLAMKRLLDFFGIRSSIKWPNDLIVGLEKICGILIEGTSVGSDPWVIVGIGLNVNMEESLLRSIDQPATSLHRLLPYPPTVHEVKQKTIGFLCEYVAIARDNSDRFREEYRTACEWLIGTNVALQTPQERLEGTVEGFTLEGHMRLRTKAGNCITVPQGVLLKID
jgi:BirA family transcriptional regulator, biotin operon repressor / biotin---[acetyl-CoA-carboxylase] ligase